MVYFFELWPYVFTTYYQYTEERLTQVTADDIEKVLQADHFVYLPDSAHGGKIFFDNSEITPFLKSASIDRQSSLIATNVLVRKSLYALQRTIADSHDIVVEGRDMGSVVFPNAQIKFFLTASLQVRALRWQHDQKLRGFVVSINEACAAVKERDERDSNRAIDPLVIPTNAIVVDNSAMTEEQTLDYMLSFIHKKHSNE